VAYLFDRELRELKRGKNRSFSASVIRVISGSTLPAPAPGDGIAVLFKRGGVAGEVGHAPNCVVALLT
jgi:hypothetical protein